MKGKCPCHSEKEYESCCKPYHEGRPAENALALMRSRYCAYALNLPDYIIKTTHPQNPFYQTDKDKWKTEIGQFSQGTRFEGLKIENFIDGPTKASVTFTAILMRGPDNVSFTEKSDFIKENGQWFYLKGQK